MQKFRFADLYRNNRKAVERTLAAMWCGEPRTESQKSYVRQLERIIPEVFAPSNAMPLVQCMNNYETVSPEHEAEAMAMVGTLWKKTMSTETGHRPPYEHQYQCWKALLKEKTPDGKPMSIVVTTGTGSGKTECFMLPLVQDLIDHRKPEQVQAIFLYPLNALMEDQKERLEKLLAGTELTYAVYNKDMPESIPNPEDKNYESVMRRIDAIKGITRDTEGNITETQYPRAIATRAELRRHPANILLTNPTMLEYILLRDKDSSLIHEKQEGETEGTLRWIALDETHTYSGAGATEIAMLLRRVLMAYGVTTDEVRFATSSATIGNGGEQAREQLTEFIAGITGVQTNQVRYVDGRRKGVEVIPNENRERWLKLINESHDGYLRLDELIEEGSTIEEKLELLDEMCGKVEAQGIEDLRVKVHYFYRVPNHGLFVDISDPHYRKDGSFRVLTENKPYREPGEAPLLEMSRCKHCGEYVAIAEEVKLENGDIGYRPITMDDSDMFDLDSTDETDKTLYVFGTTDQTETEFDNNVTYIIQGERMQNVTASNPAPPGWRVVANTQCQCPFCGTKLTKQQQEDDAPDAIQQDEEDAKRLQKFRVAADFVSRIIAPSTLDLMTETKPQKGERLLHKGQQYLSFVDSRQMAARATLKQNLEQERQWVYGTIFHALCKRATAGSMTREEAIEHYTNIYNAHTDRRDPLRRDADAKLDILEGDDEDAIRQLLSSLRPDPTLSWRDIMETLLNDPLADTFCQQFAERSEMSSELDKKGNIKPETKRKYILALMVENLSKRPLTAAAPETMGLFTSCYKDLEPAMTAELPEKVKLFNEQLTEANRISQKDWHGLMKIFLDLTVRSNESVFLNMADHATVGIFECVRFATTRSKRRSVHKPVVKDKGANNSRIIRLIAKLIANDRHLTMANAISGYKDSIQSVIDCMWEELTTKYSLLEHGTHYDSELGMQVNDKAEVVDDIPLIPYRLNLTKLGFKLYEDVYLCDANTCSGNRHVEWLRPIETTFHGYSPYVIGGEPQALKEHLHEQWEPYPHHRHNGEPKPTAETIEAWAADNRKLLWHNGLWGENGTFSERLLQTHQYPDLFIQAEHTAQVDKVVSRQVQADFKKHALNILACSTTMEMGVDLGSLELVMMTSVPPMPSNYKQRAGRSGRRGQVRSACVTLCGSDAVGIRTLLDPMQHIVRRCVGLPTVDMNSAQIIQRHVNSFLIREFGVFGMAGGSVTEQVIDFYTQYKVVPDGASNHFRVKKRDGNAPVSPTDGLGDTAGTPYEAFNNLCSEALSDELRRKLRILLSGTIFSSSQPQAIVAKAREMNEECYTKLDLRVQDYAEPYGSAQSAKQQAFFEMKFIEPLRTQLLIFWASQRFIPNANMPVSVVEFDINSSSQKGYSLVTPSNPSYPLRTALSQYAPGNPITRDGIVRTVRGIRYTNFFKPEVTFKKLYFNRDQVVIDTKDALRSLERWSVSGNTDLDLLQPAEFIPDMNEPANRILDKNIYTRVSAQLVDTDEWQQDRVEPHLFDTRSSSESGNGRILYYNEGVGYGYCHCTKCGKTVLESWTAATSSNPDKLPSEMNNIPAKETDKPNFHYSLVRKNNKPNRCIGCNSAEHIKRNVVLGDTITTDYTEIRIRHTQKDWIDSRSSNENLLITLGLLFARSLAEELNVERTDIDFAITPNGHICIFDVNLGGSGYSNQLSAMDLMKAVIDHALTIIEAAEKSGSRDALIDKFTLHYVNRIDIKAAKEWIEEERNARQTLPEAIQTTFGTEVAETSLAKMQRAFVLSQGEKFLFVDDNYKEWEYEGTEHCWKNQYINRFAPHGQQTTLCVAENRNEPMPAPALNMLRAVQGWSNEVLHIRNPFADREIYPLAYIDGRLYFTNNPNHITLNDRWGNGTIYSLRTNNFASGAKTVNTHVNEENTKIFKLGDNDPKVIKTNELGKIIHERASSIVDAFIAHCHAHAGEVVTAKYQDEHMKSILAIVLTLQTTGYFLKKMGNESTMEFLVEQYSSNTDNWKSITANLPASDSIEGRYERKVGRDEWLRDLTDRWSDDMSSFDAIAIDVAPIVPQQRRSLTHWRELSFECAGKRLSIYPDGGLMNGWFIYNDPARRTRYDIHTITHDTVINIARTQDIKFDVVIEDC